MTEHQTQVTKTAKTHGGHWYLIVTGIAVAALFCALAVFTGQLPPIWPSDTPLSKSSLENYDLTSQRWMAVSAVVMVFISTGTLILLWRTLWVTSEMLKEARETTDFAAETLKEAGRSADAAERSLEENKDLARKQAQAYVNVVSAALKIGRSGNGSLIHVSEMQLGIRNSGQTPTRKCWVEAQISVHMMDQFPVVDVHHSVKQLAFGSIAASGQDDLATKIFALEFSGESTFSLTGRVHYQTVYEEYFQSEFFFVGEVQAGEASLAMIARNEVDVLLHPRRMVEANLYVPTP